MTHSRGTELEVRVTGQDIRQWLRRAADVLRDHVEQINRINVFPVADGDTGFNMLGTLEAAVCAIEGSPCDDLGETLGLAAAGAVKGARGNSGTILSQILVGLAQFAYGKEAWTLREYCQSWTMAYEISYSSVSEPVEGTILTVARTIASHASGPDRDAVTKNITAAARKAVENSPTLLPALQARGVVDAGAEGLYLIVAALSDSTLESAKEVVGGWRQGPHKIGPTQIVYPFDVEALLSPWGPGQSAERLREQLAEWGDSVVISEMDMSLKIHLHTKEASAFTRFLFELGPVVQMEIRDMRHQEREVMGQRRVVRIDPAWVPFLPIDIDVWDPRVDVGLDESLLWVGSDGPPRGNVIVSPFLACQLMMDYDEAKPWHSNVAQMLTAAEKAVTISVSRDRHCYQVRDLALVTKEQAVAAVKALIGTCRMVTMYLSLAEWGGEAEWWQTQLDAEVVDAPSVTNPNQIEIVAQ